MINGLDIQFFLETCEYLKHFVAEQQMIDAAFMTPAGRELSTAYEYPGLEDQLWQMTIVWTCE